MPDTNPKQEMYDRLANLSDQINTTKGFGMMGLLEQQQQERQQPAAPEAPIQAPPEASKPEVNLSEILDPINSSLRAFSETTSREIGSLRNDLSSLRQQQAAPEEVGEVDPVAQKLSSFEQQLLKTKLDTAWERARNSYNAAKTKYGNDFDYKEEDLRNTWHQHIGNNVKAAESTNWDLYMQQQYDTRRAPRLEKRLSELEGELAKVKSGAVDPMAAMGAMPRANRNGAPPAVNPGITNDFDEDVYRRASDRMGKRIGSFAGFNRLLVDEQNKKLLRTAS